MLELEWEKLEIGSKDGLKFLQRAKAPGGWLIWLSKDKPLPGDKAPPSGLMFYADPNHKWNGSFLPK
jgi:hypothetical protein